MSFVENSFTDSASLIAHYRAVKQRIYGKPRNPLTSAPVGSGNERKWAFIYLTPVKIERPPEKIAAHIPGPVPDYALPEKKRNRDYLWVSEPKPVLEVGVPESLTRWKEIIAEVCAKHGVSYIDAISDRRWKALVTCRAEIYYRLYCETTMSLPEIGRRLGGKDHTTVLYGIRRHMRDNDLVDEVAA